LLPFVYFDPVDITVLAKFACEPLAHPKTEVKAAWAISGGNDNFWVRQTDLDVKEERGTERARQVPNENGSKSGMDDFWWKRQLLGWSDGFGR
jgi:hypothetical protein